MPHTGTDIFAALKTARENKGLSQRDLSARVGLPQSHISKIEHGAVDLQVSSLVALARALDLETLLVPRKLVPAVEAIIKDETRSGSTDETTLRTATYLNRLRNLAKGATTSPEDRDAQDRFQRSVRDLSNMRLTKSELELIRAVSVELKKASRDPKRAREELHVATRKLQSLRNAIAHRVSESAPLPTIRPAYALDEDADA
jgi:transcriptional regulator with XRE-family HTH domain